METAPNRVEIDRPDGCRQREPVFLILVVFWLTAVFISFGLFAPRNATVIATLLFCALAVATAIFLILELNSPYSRLIRLRPDPLQAALAQLGH